MDRNIVIILVSTLIVASTAFMIIRWKRLAKLAKFLGISIFIVWLLSTGLPNRQFVLSPATFKTEALSGRVIDSETKAPVSNCNIKALWILETITPAGGHWAAYHQVNVQSDARGEFHIPPYQKALGVYGFFPFLARRDGGQRLAVYGHGYKYEILWPTASATLELKKLKNPIDYLENIFHLDMDVLSKTNYQKNILAADKQYIIDECEAFDNVYPSIDYQIIKNGQYLGQMAHLFVRLHEYPKAIALRKKQMRLFPDEAAFALGEMNDIKRLMQRKEEVQ